MSGTTTINGSSVMSQFTPGTSASVAFNAITASGAMFSVDTTSGAFGTAGPVSVGGMNITATFANATIVYSTAISSSLTVTTLPQCEGFCRFGRHDHRGRSRYSVRRRYWPEHVHLYRQ